MHPDKFVASAFVPQEVEEAMKVLNSKVDSWREMVGDLVDLSND
jgi:hypothetical protein